MSTLACSLYKTCNYCNETKWYKEFASKGYRRRRAYCRQCNKRYSFDISKLSNTDIRIQDNYYLRRRKKIKISFEVAKMLVQNGEAGIVHEKLLHRFAVKKNIKNEGI